MLALAKFLNFLNLDENQLNQLNFTKTNKENITNSQEIVMMKKEENVIKKETQNFTEYTDNGVIEKEVEIEFTPISKNEAIKNVKTTIRKIENQIERKIN